jgi:hypothetical protein
MSGLGLPKSIERIPEILDKYKPNGPADKLNLNTSLLDYKNKKEISTDFVDPFEEKNLSSNLDDPFKNEESKDNSDIPSWLK